MGLSLRGEAGGCQRRPAGGAEPPAIGLSFASDHVKDVQQDDDRDRDPDEPKKNAAHVIYPFVVAGLSCFRVIAESR